MLNNCLYVFKNDGKLFLHSPYVDDIIVAGSNLEGIQNLKKKFTEAFDIKDLKKLNHYLGMKITRSYKGIKIDHSTYA